MEWKPNRWIAAVLCVLFVPWGMLYVQRPRLALTYFLLVAALQVVLVGALHGGAADGVAIAMGVLSWGVTIGAAVHAFRIAKASPVIPTRRWYSRGSALAGIPAVFFVVVFLFRAFLYEPFHLPAESMHPTFPEGSMVIVKKLGYGDYGTFGITLWRAEPTAAVARGDLILFRLADGPRTVYLKRVIGLPGDRVECREQRLIINGVPVPMQLGTSGGIYQYATEIIDSRQVTIALIPERPGKECDEVVPAAHYFVLGDSRDNSRDSRHFGMVSRQSLVGSVAAAIKAENRHLPR